MGKHFAYTIEKILEQKDRKKLGHYQLRLKGVLDLFTL
jgi:hypothetical protein